MKRENFSWLLFVIAIFWLTARVLAQEETVQWDPVDMGIYSVTDTVLSTMFWSVIAGLVVGFCRAPSVLTTPYDQRSLLGLAAHSTHVAS